MSTKPDSGPTAPRGYGWGTTLALGVPMCLLTLMMLMGGPRPPQDPLRLIPLLVTWIFINGLFILMLRTGRTDRYRAILFIALAFAFVLTFITNLVEIRGSMALSEEDMLTGKTPFCHLVIPMTVIPAALTRTIIFPGSMLGGFAPIGAMLVLWLGVSIALGRGWCSWGCFFGGLEEGFSRVRRRAVIRHIDARWTYLPYAVLLVVVLTSAAFLSPTYCMWLCPFKTVTEFPAINSTLRAVQAGIFGSLFAGLVVALPILTRRRTQCGLFCPFGAFQSAANKVSAFDIRIDRDVCNRCGLCTTVCPTFSLDERSLEKGKPRVSCSQCGKCVDACTRRAITYHVKGTSVDPCRRRDRLLFMLPAFLLLAVMGGGMIQGALQRLLLLATTGRLIQ